MSIELKVPAVGESITEVQIGEWLVPQGESAGKEDPLVVIETDKVTVELPAPVAGMVTRILKAAGSTAEVGEIIGYMEEGDGAAAPAKAKDAGSDDDDGGDGDGDSDGDDGDSDSDSDDGADARPDAKAKGKGASSRKSAPKKSAAKDADSADTRVMPAAARLLEEHGLSADDVEATGPGGRLLKEDVLRHVEQAPAKEKQPKAKPGAKPASKPGAQDGTPSGDGGEDGDGKADARPARPKADGGYREEEIVPLTPLRKRIAERLVEAQQTAALLTTFNEVDMSAAKALREEHKAAFEERYGIKLGFMSFFVKAAVDALKLVPRVNAELRDGSIVFKNYQDIGVAVGGGKGLVVPVLRGAERMSFAEVEQTIGDLASRAKANKLKIEELQGGTFTISNGGIYGSLMSTPIVNPPQSAILGLHAIQDRPVAIDGQVVVRPMMYVALTYDHRLIDGREAVTFLKRIKDCVENPSRMLLEI
jgi:2-oxoglutarate dehydrogenase E2 component (dihydrolipoamide succinyltransferase)